MHPFRVGNVPFGWNRQLVSVLGNTVYSGSSVLGVLPQTKLGAKLPLGKGQLSCRNPYIHPVFI